MDDDDFDDTRRYIRAAADTLLQTIRRYRQTVNSQREAGAQSLMGAGLGSEYLNNVAKGVSALEKIAVSQGSMDEGLKALGTAQAATVSMLCAGSEQAVSLTLIVEQSSGEAGDHAGQHCENPERLRRAVESLLTVL